MNLKQAFDAIAPAIGSKPPMDVVTFGKGLVWANDTMKQLMIPVSIEGSEGKFFSVKGAALKAVLGKFENVDVTLLGDKLIIRAGKARVTIETMDPAIEAPVLEGEEVPVNDGWMTAITALGSIVDAEAGHSWLRGVLFYEDCAAAIGGGTSFMAWTDKHHFGGAKLIISGETIDAVKGRQGLKSLTHGDGFVCALWEDGLLLRSQLLIGEAPEIIRTKMATWADVDKKIDEPWKVAVRRAAALSDGVVVFENGAVKSEGKGLFTNDEDGGGVLDAAAFGDKTMELLLQHGSHVGGTGYPAFWKGDVLQGMAMGRNR